MCQRDTAAYLAGTVADHDLRGCLIMTRNSGIVTGLGNRVWELRLFGAGHTLGAQVATAASPRTFVLSHLVVPKKSYYILAVPYPRGTSINVSLHAQYHGGTMPLSMADSLAVVMNQTEALEEDIDICPDPRR